MFPLVILAIPALAALFEPRMKARLGLNVRRIVATSSAAGPTIGGSLLAIAPWPWLFAVNVPIGVVTACIGAPFFLFVLVSRRAQQGVL